VITDVSVPAQASAPADGDARVETSVGPCLPWHGSDYMTVFTENGTFCLGGAGTVNRKFRPVWHFHSGNNQGNVTWCNGKWTPFDKWINWDSHKLRSNCIKKITIY
jgi:hypothetical protein